MYVTHDKNFMIPFETIYFKLIFDINTSHTGKIMGYNFNTKNYEELYNNDTFQINDKYYSLNYIFSEREKNNHGTHIKLNIIVYNSPEILNLSQTVSNLGIFEYYFCQDSYNICDSDFYSNCINEFKCYEYCPKKHNKSNNSNKCEYCHPDCKTCYDSFTENNSSCESCSSPNKYIKYGNCVDSCINGYYNDIKDSSIKICKCDLINCLLCSIESLNYYNSCLACNKEEGYYPIFNDIYNNINLFIKCYKSPKGYFLEEEFYKKCYKSCEKCDIGGNETFHNCIDCNINYIYEINYGKYKNCYTKCSYYYYHIKNKDNKDKYYCTKELKCNEKYNKLIYGTKECIDDCSKISANNFKNICYIDCPEGSIKSEEKPYYCDIVCPSEKPFEIIEAQECVNNCSLNLMREKLCIINYGKIKEIIKEEEIDIAEKNKKEKDREKEDIKAQDIILENFEEGFTSDEYNTSDLDEGKDEIYETGKMIITLTTSINQKNKYKQNLTTIDLGNCEILLRNYYKIQDNKKIYIKKIDVPQEGMKIPKTEYNVYCKLYDKNLIRLIYQYVKIQK